MSFFRAETMLGRALCLVLLACAASGAKAGGPTFLVSVNNTATRFSGLLEVETAPFATSVIASTNAGIVTTNNAPWPAMAFGPGGTLYGASTGGALAAINPADAASATLSLLRQTNGSTVAATGLTFASNGAAYVLDGSDTLYLANPASGVCAPVGVFSHAGAGGLPLVLAEAPNGTMFGLFLSLYTVNLTNAQLTQIGSAFPFGDGTQVVYALGAAFGSDGQLYMVGTSTPAEHPKPYQVNTNNGLITAVGILPVGASGLVALPATNSGAPVVVIPPVGQSVLAGQTATFSASVSGTPAPKAQWYFGSAEYPGATNLTLAIADAAFTNAGNYSLVLSNSAGLATSQVATLSVMPPILASTGAFAQNAGPTNTLLGLMTNPPMENVLSSSNPFYSCLCFDSQRNLFAAGEYLAISAGSSGPSETISQNSGLFVIDPARGTTNLIGNFQINGTALRTPVKGLGFSPSGVLYASYGGSLYTVNATNAQMTLVGAYSAASASQLSPERQDVLGLPPAPPAPPPPGGSPPPGQVEVAGIAFAPDGSLYGGQTNLYQINPANATVTLIGALNGANASILGDMKYGSDRFLYFFDDGSDGNLYRLNPASAQVSIVASYPSTLSGLAFVPTPTTIVTEPQNQLVLAGASASFSVTATGAPPLDYQWFFKNAAIAAATNPLLTITNAGLTNEGPYFVVVSNAMGPVTSSIVTLSAYSPATITQPPKAQLVLLAGKTISLTVKATGKSLSYQWQLNGVNLPGQISPTLTIPTATASNGGTYTILVSTPYVAMPATATSVVSVLPDAPVISAPANNSLLGNVSLTVTGTEPANGGAAAILYQLNTGAVQGAQVSTNGLTWSAPVTLQQGSNTFKVWATNAWGTSATAQEVIRLNEFPAMAGSYDGLFYDTNSPAFTNAGYFTLTVGSNGLFTGDVALAGATTPFSGAFDTDGLAAVVASNTTGPVFDVSLQLDLISDSLVTGTVSNTMQSWSASLTANRAPFGPTLAASAYAGTYVLAITGSSDAATAPAGYSYAVATVSTGGNASIVLGSMADGTTYSASGGISRNGEWPLYGSLNSGKGSVLAWVKFPAHSQAVQATASQAMWFETAATRSNYYPRGFALLNNELLLLVNRFVPPPAGVAVLRNTNYTISLVGGNLLAIISDTAKINASDVVTPGANMIGLTVTLAPQTGSFSGSFVNPVTGQTTPLQGIILPESDAAYGWFPGTNQAGGIVIQRP